MALSRTRQLGWRNTMKKALLGAVGLVMLGLSAPASAADLAARPYTKAPSPVAVPVYDWSGFYAGINGGWGSAHKCWDITEGSQGTIVFAPPVSMGCHDATGGTAGGQVGYRWQMTSWVFGVEAQGNWAGFKGSNNNVVFPAFPLTDQSKVDAFGLFTAQVGYAWNNVLLYLKGGAAVADDKYMTFNTPTGLPFDQSSETRWGGAVGVGLEYGFAPNWSVAFEYDHLFMGTHNQRGHGLGNFATAPLGGFTGSADVHQDVDLATVRVNYRFGGPVVAKY
jgi:outer membrane immunogenic protein